MDQPKRVRKVTVKTERTFVFRSRDSIRLAWCAECGAEVGMVSVDGAAREAGLSELTIYKLIEERALHFSEDAEGRVLICLDSVQRCAAGCDHDGAATGRSRERKQSRERLREPSGSAARGPRPLSWKGNF